MRALFRRLAAGLPVLVLAASCGGAEVGLPGGGQGSQGGGAAADASLFGADGALVGHAGQPCQSDGDCGAGGLCDPGKHACGCGGTPRHGAATCPPNLLIVHGPVLLDAEARRGHAQVDHRRPQR